MVCLSLGVKATSCYRLNGESLKLTESLRRHDGYGMNMSGQLTFFLREFGLVSPNHLITSGHD